MQAITSYYVEYLFIYSDRRRAPRAAAQYFLDRVIFAPRNSDVNDLGCSVLSKMPGQDIVLYSADSIENEPGADNYQDPLPVELLRTLQPSGLPSVSSL